MSLPTLAAPVSTTSLEPFPPPRHLGNGAFPQQPTTSITAWPLLIGIFIVLSVIAIACLVYFHLFPTTYNASSPHSRHQAPNTPRQPSVELDSLSLSLSHSLQPDAIQHLEAATFSPRPPNNRSSILPSSGFDSEASTTTIIEPATPSRRRARSLSTRSTPSNEASSQGYEGERCRGMDIRRT